LAVQPSSNEFQGASSSQSWALSRTYGHTDGFMEDSTPSSIETGAKKAHSTGDQLDVTHVENQDDFNPDSYQNSLGTIITRMSDAVVPEDVKGYEHSYPGSDRFLAPLSNTVSVEPLHFLGIAPTAEKAALLSACKFAFLLVRIKQHRVNLSSHSRQTPDQLHRLPRRSRGPQLLQFALRALVPQIPSSRHPLNLHNSSHTI
jgi:hypothetical protein